MQCWLNNNLMHRCAVRLSPDHGCFKVTWERTREKNHSCVSTVHERLLIAPICVRICRRIQMWSATRVKAVAKHSHECRCWLSIKTMAVVCAAYLVSSANFISHWPESDTWLYFELYVFVCLFAYKKNFVLGLPLGLYYGFWLCCVQVYLY